MAKQNFSVASQRTTIARTLADLANPLVNSGMNTTNVAKLLAEPPFNATGAISDATAPGQRTLVQATALNRTTLPTLNRHRPDQPFARRFRNPRRLRRLRPLVHTWSMYAFDDSQSATSAHRRTAARAFGRSVSAPRGHSRVAKFSTRHQERVTPSTRTIMRSIWLEKSSKARRCAAAWRDRGFRHFWAHAVDARASDSGGYGAG
jgi:hypothetical protein